MGTAITQSQLWGQRVRDWAEVQEGQSASIFAAVLRQVSAPAGASLLDIGCGSGGLCQMAAGLGLQVSGLDSAEPFLSIARQRMPQGDFRVGEMEELPYADQSFDVVAGINAFQFAANPVTALRQASRVAKSAAPVVIVVFARPAACQASAYFTVLGSLLPPPPPGSIGPFALSADGALEALVDQAGMRLAGVAELDYPWSYPDEATLLRGLLSPGPAIRAIQTVGEAVTAAAILNALAPFKTASGGYLLENKARCITATA